MIQTRIHNHDGKTTFERVQDCNAIAEYTKARHNEGHHGSSDMRIAASVPMVIVEKYLNDNGIDYREFSINPVHKKRLLNDPANAMFRIWAGRV